MSQFLPHKPKDGRIQNLYRGCLVGGAVGDALGAPVEFMQRSQIIRQFGPNGIQEFVPAFGKLGAITDDTQMTLFTAEGMLRSWVRGSLKGICHMPGVMVRAYQRWLHTQGYHNPMHDQGLDGWLLEQQELFSRRAPGMTCLSALKTMRDANEVAVNESKGCGGVMRVAPVAMYWATRTGNQHQSQKEALGDTFKMACEAAAITHGHVTGQLASGAFAVIILKLLSGQPLMLAADAALHHLKTHRGHEETYRALQNACQLAIDQPNDPQVLAQLGGGWVAEEALAIAVYSALSSKDFRSGVTLAVNHDGDSDSTGSIAGQMLGASLGVGAIPSSWTEHLELKDVIEEIADDFATLEEWDLDESDEYDHYFKKYPGW